MQPVASNAFDSRHSPPENLARNVFCGAIALTCVTLACAWTLLRGDLSATSIDPVASSYYVVVSAPAAPKGDRAPRVVAASAAAPRVAAATAPLAPAASPAAPTASAESAPDQVDITGSIQRATLTAPSVDVALFDATSSSGTPLGAFSASALGPLDDRFAVPAPPEAAIPVAQDTPRLPPSEVRRVVQSAPTPRSAEARAPKVVTASLDDKAPTIKAVPSAPVAKPTMFEKLFGKPQAPEGALAYAPTDGTLSDESPATGRYDRYTAVYDISGHTVYLPDGTKLEAHSGLGSMMDDPNHTHIRMRGATPAHVYDLEPRSILFHGVQAIRLKPIGGEGAIFNRNGILAHTYMLGPRGESNGCVSFKNYAAFLRAFQNREIKRLAVVARLD